MVLVDYIFRSRKQRVYIYPSTFSISQYIESNYNNCDKWDIYNNKNRTRLFFASWKWFITTRHTHNKYNDVAWHCNVDVAWQCNVDVAWHCKGDVAWHCNVDVAWHCNVDVAINCNVDVAINCNVDVAINCNMNSK